MFVPMFGLRSGIICDRLDGLFGFLKPFRLLYWLRIIQSYAIGESILFVFLQFCSGLLFRGFALRYLRDPFLYLLSRFNVHEYYQLSWFLFYSHCRTLRLYEIGNINLISDGFATLVRLSSRILPASAAVPGELQHDSLTLKLRWGKAEKKGYPFDDIIS
ncbi:uncharacterized protein K441DRAFT_175418 [Cenococcum geophilum 1.58]|uniref:uncharacterized protein n=1 Tax=Cenococcum geophilum 1.58 TaxID=794803 RepID=UPI00358FDB79|nr:hypothetical protein K441DRAFT_175418 [Cenococcum geophilum 1.58]